MQISILGCGWLGLPLAKALTADGHEVKGSTTTEAKLEVLRKARIEPYSISLTVDRCIGDPISFLQNSDVLIIDIPPKLRGAVKENFIAKIEALISEIEKSDIKKVLFVSSTSVYADDNSVVTEATIPNPDSEGGRQLLESENLLHSNPHFKTTVLRFGGLIGEDRHPVHYLAGRENLENPDGPVNLIHRKDCIGIIKKIIEMDIWAETFNAAAPYHPTRKEYYSQKAKELRLELPKFCRDNPSFGKTIGSDKLTNALNYSFQIQP